MNFNVRCIIVHAILEIESLTPRDKDNTQDKFESWVRYSRAVLYNIQNNLHEDVSELISYINEKYEEDLSIIEKESDINLTLLRYGKKLLN